ncbi:MAG: replicative DNA helicase [Verrucomicrobia bacterium]|nr:replicative DNA helicase [Leptolyngbya sp. ES-bin-22]
MENLDKQKLPANVIRLQERVLPSNLEAEEVILGGCLIDPNAIERVLDVLPENAFYSAQHKLIYQAMLALNFKGVPCDVMQVLSWLNDRGTLDKAGGQPKLAKLMDQSVGAVNIDLYAKLIVDKWQRRQLIQVGQEIATIGAQNDRELSELIDAAEQKLFSATLGNRSNSVSRTEDLVLPVYQEIESRYEGKTLPGLSCGFYDLDSMTQGFQRSDLVIIAARPSMGKSSFLTNMLTQMAAFHKLPSLVFSLEMSKEQLTHRMLSSFARIESGRLRAGRVEQSEWEPLGVAVSQLASLPVYIDDTPNPTIGYIRSKARQVAAENGAIGPFGIDYLQLMGGDSDNRVNELTKITRSLKILARELNTPIFALSQLSRGVESRTNKRPMMADLRDSGSIEQDADLVIMLFRDEYYNPDTVDRGIAEIIITKHRNGPTGTVKLLFEHQFTQFRNLAAPGRKA